ncbi:MAG: cardiolipin synthase [Phycisphaerales bacterium]
MIAAALTLLAAAAPPSAPAPGNSALLDALTTTQLILITDWTLKVLIALRVIMNRRPVPVTLAWLMVLLIPVPYVGVVLYAIIGEVRLGRRRLARYRRLTEGFAARATFLWRARSHHWTAETELYKHISEVASRVGEMPPLRGNTVELFSGAQTFIDALIRDIDAAASRVHLFFYIWIDHGPGLQVAEAVERAARRGVECRVMVDAVGSKWLLFSRIPERLRRAGVKFAVSLPVNPIRMLFARLDLRNHRKIAVIDGWTAYTGSQNIAWTTFRRKGLRKKGPYIDAMARVTGPAAQAIEVVFLRDWEVESDEALGDTLEQLLPERPTPEGGSVIQVVPSGPDAPPQAMIEAFITTIYSARRELIMTTPYFVPDEPSKHALIAAAMRGVEVTLVIPDEHDSAVVAAAARAHFQDLLEAGVRIKHHTSGLLHSKTLTVDASIGLIGSANFDLRSFVLNFELSLFIFDADVASQLRMLQMSYMEDSVDVFLEEWRARPYWRRALDDAARLLGPLL